MKLNEKIMISHLSNFLYLFRYLLKAHIFGNKNWFCIECKIVKIPNVSWFLVQFKEGFFGMKSLGAFFMQRSREWIILLCLNAKYV